MAVGCLAAATTACGAGETGDPAPSASEPSAEATASGTPTTDPSDPEDDMLIRITIGEERFTATLEDSAAADDLLAQLPVTIDMTDHGGVEKTGPLPSPLALDGQPDGADPDVGDLGYYAPGNDLVLYYGDQSYFPGIVVLGQLDGDAAARIARLDGTVTASVEAG
ncbi:hypothetical protein H1W00_12085 [Aeromicrobium sp. Marseille-Q0843]|uniref:Cyclophilin-like domain-containing protein n=2 Tax=Aeromicrobium phoceense TaxID=2754045 RepID=A0A838XCM5_9ACTN|nr:cyclophilin-like fold protein [Aeromicrobium phoceense]MBA4609219.1 hypothetical protein [Aeromicrobium phoceense]